MRSGQLFGDLGVEFFEDLKDVRFEVQPKAVDWMSVRPQLALPVPALNRLRALAQELGCLAARDEIFKIQ